MFPWISLKSTLEKTLKAGVTVVKWACVIHCTVEYVVDGVICTGPSMVPTINSNDIILTEHISPQYGRVDRNDIVVARSPSNPKQLICKRVIGITGDQIIQPNGYVATIPKGHVWVEGDNELNSTDSRTYGPIPIGLIKGRAILKIWPLTNIGLLMPPKENSHY